MQTFDAIVIGAGLTGAAIAYELQRQGQQVMLLESSLQQPNATMLGYGGILHWAGKTPLQRQLCQESRQRWSHLTHELRGETEYRELDLLLYLTAADDPYALLTPLQSCHIPPQFVDSATARSLEPLLNSDRIQGAFVIPQGHVHPGKTVRAYIASFLHQGGHLSLGTVRQLLGMPHRINGVATDKAVFHAPRVIMAAGARGRQLLQPFFDQLPLYFTHAYLLKTPPIAPRLKTLLMPANINRRINLEATAPQYDWHQTTLATPPSVLEAGAVQFLDGQLCIGQLSVLHPDLDYGGNLLQIHAQLQAAIAPILPHLSLPKATCHHCLVAYTDHPMPLVGELPSLPGLVLFTGFTHPWVYVPPLAQRLASSLTGTADPVITTLSRQLATRAIPKSAPESIG